MNEVKEAFAGKEPNRGGYGSVFNFREYEGGTVVELEAQWAPRHNTPAALVTKVEGENVTFQFMHYGKPDGDVRTRTAEDLADWLAEQASGS